MLSPPLAIDRISKLLTRIEFDATPESTASYAAATRMIAQLKQYTFDHLEDAPNIRGKLTTLEWHTNGCYGLCNDGHSAERHRNWAYEAISALREPYMFGRSDHP